MLITRLICIQWKSWRFLSPVSTVSARTPGTMPPFWEGPTKKKRKRNACIFSLALLQQARPKRTSKAARLDRNAARKQRTGQTKHHEHRLRLQAVEPDAPRWSTHGAERTKVLWLLPAQCFAKTRRVNFCWQRRSCAWIRHFSIFIKSRVTEEATFPRCFSFSLFFQILNIEMDAKLSKIYCSPQWYWKVLTAIKKLAAGPKIPEDAAKKLPIKHTLGKLILPRQSTFLAPNSMCPRQMQFTKQTFFYHMTIKTSLDLTINFHHKHSIVPTSCPWVSEDGSERNRDEAIKEKTVSAKPAAPYLRPVGKMKKLPSNVNVCYLYQPGGLERGRQRATDPIWSLKVYNVLPPLVKAQRANCVSARRPETGVCAWRASYYSA